MDVVVELKNVIRTGHSKEQTRYVDTGRQIYKTFIDTWLKENLFKRQRMVNSGDEASLRFGVARSPNVMCTAVLSGLPHVAAFLT